MDKALRKQIWSNFLNTRFKTYIVEIQIEKFQRLERNINLFIAFGSSSSVAAWYIMEIMPWFWSGIIVLLQIINIIKPYFPLAKIAKELDKKSIEAKEVIIEYEQLWNLILLKKIDNTIALSEFKKVKIKFNSAFHFSIDTIFKVSKGTTDKANQKMKSYLKRNFDISIDV